MPRQRLRTPYLAFFRSMLDIRDGLLRVHWVTVVADGRIDFAVCGKATATHRWVAVNDAHEKHRARLVACRFCCQRAPEQFTHLPRTL